MDKHGAILTISGLVCSLQSVVCSPYLEFNLINIIMAWLQGSIMTDPTIWIAVLGLYQLIR